MPPSQPHPRPLIICTSVCVSAAPSSPPVPQNHHHSSKPLLSITLRTTLSDDDDDVNKQTQLRRRQVTEQKKNYELPVPRAFGEQSDHGTLHGSAGPCKHGYHGIIDVMAGHQRMDTCRCLLGASQLRQSLKKSFARPYQRRRHIGSSHHHALCQITVPVMRRSVCWRRKWCWAWRRSSMRWRPRHNRIRRSTKVEATVARSPFPRWSLM